MNRAASGVTIQSHLRGIFSIFGWTDDSTRPFADSGAKKQSSSGLSRLIA